MKFMNMGYTHKYMNEAKEGEGGSGGDEDVTLEKLQASLADLQKSNDSLAAKNNELLSETKKAKNQKRESEATALKEAEEKARAAGDHEQLYKSAMSENEKLKDMITSRDERDNKSKVESQAMKMAVTLADGNNAELLSEQIAKRLKVSDGEVKVTDGNGELTVSTFDDLTTIFKNNERFASLLKGNQSNGGGAGGGDNANGSGATKTITRAEFNELTAVAQSSFMLKERGQVTDN